MRYFWYISKAKVESLASQQETVLERLRATLSALVKAELKVPVGSIGVELKSNNPEPSLIKLLERVENKLKAENLVRTAKDASTGGVPLFFEFGGPAARLIREGQFWAATVDGNTGVLLGGSAVHCIGGAVPEKPPLSPSINPIASMDALLENRAELGQEDRVSFTWAKVVQDSMQSGSLQDLPLGRGVAIFAARFAPVPWQIKRSGYQRRINSIIVGSPLYVEQVTSVP
jgi:hypothetical protein